MSAAAADVWWRPCSRRLACCPWRFFCRCSALSPSSCCCVATTRAIPVTMVAAPDPLAQNAIVNLGESAEG